MTNPTPSTPTQAEPIYKGFTEAQIREAFDRVCDPSDWKAEILAECPGELVLLVTASIEFFTGTTPTISLDIRRMVYIISSVGYRAGPAGDN